MSSLINTKIKDTYTGLLKTSDNAPIDGTLRDLQDGNGGTLPIQVSTTGVNFTGNVTGLPAVDPAGLVAGTGTNSIMSTLTAVPATATNTQSIGIGYNADATGAQSICIGTNALASARASIAIGENTDATGGATSIAIGGDSQATDLYCVAVGDNARASQDNAIAIGKNTIASANGAVALGNNFTASTVNTVTVKKLQMLDYATLDYADDTAAATGGIPLGGVYHTSGALKIRIA